MLQTFFKQRAAHSPLAPIVEASRRAFRAIGVTSGVINVLTLTGSIFMMQVYDRVIASNSLPTLYSLAIMAIVAYAFQGWLEIMRGKMLSLIGEKVDVELAPQVHAAGLRAAGMTPTGVQDAIQAQRDLESIRGFMTGPGLVAMFDMPWILLYVVVTTLLHPLFGLTTLVAALLLMWLTWKTEVTSKPMLKEAIELSIKRQQLADGTIRNSEVIAGNGMYTNMARRLADLQSKFLAAQRKASFVIARYGNIAKTIRLVLQSFVLGLGAYLALQGKISSGAIIGASILVARALAPIDQAINGWRPFVAAREGHERIVKLLGRKLMAKQLMPLPPPKQSINVKDLTVAAPGGTTLAVQGVAFNAKAGEAMAVIGHSAAGKSSLFRALVGAWKLNRGVIEFDGTNPEQWEIDVLGRHIGYLPQNVQLFEGTIAENISRFDAGENSKKIQTAAQAAGLDEYIRKQFPEHGYNTPLSAGAENLSGGQRQRIGLARALYGDPFLVVLDEPTSNLDQSGREALALAIRGVKARGGIVLVSAHDPAVWAEVDSMLALHQGKPEWFGRRDEVFALWLERHHPEQYKAHVARLQAQGLPIPGKGQTGASQPQQAPVQPQHGPVQPIAALSAARPMPNGVVSQVTGAASNGAAPHPQGQNGVNGYHPPRAAVPVGPVTVVASDAAPVGTAVPRNGAIPGHGTGPVNGTVPDDQKASWSTGTARIASVKTATPPTRISSQPAETGEVRIPKKITAGEPT